MYMLTQCNHFDSILDRPKYFPLLYHKEPIYWSRSHHSYPASTCHFNLFQRPYLTDLFMTSTVLSLALCAEHFWCHSWLSFHLTSITIRLQTTQGRWQFIYRGAVQWAINIKSNKRNLDLSIILPVSTQNKSSNAINCRLLCNLDWPFFFCYKGAASWCSNQSKTVIVAEFGASWNVSIQLPDMVSTIKKKYLDQYLMLDQPLERIQTN